MKLAHGFEIMCHKSDSNGSQGNLDSEVPTSGIRWQQYIQSLKDKNYFRGELEGSVMYEKLLVNAVRFYKENFKPADSEQDAGAEVLNLLKILDVDIEGRRRAEQYLEPPDDDSWMNLTPESLDEMMRERSGNYGNKEDSDVFDLSKVADSMKAFVGNISGVDGAEFPSAGDDDEDDDADIQFDGSGFISAMQEMFEFEDSGSNSSSDMDEYGWEEDEDGKMSTSKHAKIKRPPSLDKYMDIMDRELSKTDVGKSFEKQKRSPKKMEKEAQPQDQSPSKDINDEDDDFQPVDIDLNTVKNLLESYGAQEGLAGPASNILGSMGVNIPPNMDNIENGENTGILTGKPNTDKKKSKVSFEESPRMAKEAINVSNVDIENKVNIEQKSNRNTGNKPTPKSKPKPAARRPEGSSPKKAPPRPPPPHAVRPRARLDSKETDV